MSLGTLHLVLHSHQRLAKLRKDRGISQKDLAEAIGVHVTQVRRYEAGSSQPTLDVLRALAKKLRVSADGLLFDPTERPIPDQFAPHLEALARLDKEERRVAREVLDALLLKHDAKKWAG